MKSEAQIREAIRQLKLRGKTPENKRMIKDLEWVLEDSA